MIKILLGLTFFIQVASAKEIYTYSIGDEVIIIKKVGKLMVNKSCENKKCDAYKNGISLKSYNPPPKELEGGKNPLSVSCKNKFSGKVVIAKDLKGNGQSLCQFKDQSYLVLR
jgi:hypothetical protein